MKIHVEVADPAWRKAFGKDLLPLVRSACKTTLKHAPEFSDLPKNLEFTVKLASDAEVRELNRDFRGKDKPTNVLSFPGVESLDDLADEPYLGDLILAYETLAVEAKEQKKTLKAHCLHLLVHGVLHLVGYDHELGEEEANIMEKLEIKILRELSIANPYTSRV